MREFPNATKRPWKRIGWMPCGLYGPGDIVYAARIATIDRRTEHDDDAALIVHAVNTMEERELLLEEAAVILRDLVELALSTETEIHGLTGTVPVDCECVGCGTRAFLAKLEARDA